MNEKDRHIGQYQDDIVLISTVRLRTPEPDHLGYETLIFPKGSWSDLFEAQYSTNEEAHEGHEFIVKLYELSREYRRLNLEETIKYIECGVKLNQKIGKFL